VLLKINKDFSLKLIKTFDPATRVEFITGASNDDVLVLLRNTGKIDLFDLKSKTLTTLEVQISSKLAQTS